MKILVKALVLSVISAVVIGCSSSDSDPSIRVIHLSPDAPNVDVLLDGVQVLNDVPYLANSGYLTIDQGLRNIIVNAAGTNTTVIDATPEFFISKSLLCLSGRATE